MNTKGFSAKLWLFIARNGRVTTAEIRAEFGPEEYSQTLKSRITDMCTRGLLKRFDNGLYGVTAQCKVPFGLTVTQVLEATGAKE